MNRKYWMYLDSTSEGDPGGGALSEDDKAFADLLDEEGGEGLPEPAPAPAAVPPSPAAPPVEPPVTPSPPASPPPTEPAAPAAPIEPAAAPVPAPTPPVQPTPAAPPPVPSLTVEQLAELRKKARERLQEEYKLTPELATALATEPEVVMPQIMADLHLKVQSQILDNLQQALPTLFNALSSSQEAERAAKEAFFGKWPGLRQYEGQVLAMGEMFRKANKDATPDVAVERIGQMTAIALGLDPAVARAAAAAPAPATPPGAPPPPRRPAGIGGAGAPVSSEPPNIFTQLAAEEDD